MSVIELSVAGFIYYNLTDSAQAARSSGYEGQAAFGWTYLRLGWSFLGPFIAYLISLAILSIIGCVLLLQKDKDGLHVSLAALTMWTVTSSYVTFGWLLAPNSFVYNSASYTIGVSLLVSTAIMYILLIIGWNRVP